MSIAGELMLQAGMLFGAYLECDMEAVRGWWDHTPSYL